MIIPPRCPWHGVALLAMLCAHAAHAGVVTVNVTSQSGATTADAVIVFDPLDAAPPAAHGTAVIDQVNKQFVPRVSVVRTGTAITFPNSDHIRHQVYSFSKANTFTLKLYAGTTAAPVTFEHPGLVILGCNIHDKMVAFVGVVDSPYFAKTANSGSAALDLPAGHYRLRVWHPNETIPIPMQDVTVSAAPLNIPLRIDLDSESRAVAAWPG
jgi:plastocyanin